MHISTSVLTICAGYITNLPSTIITNEVGRALVLIQPVEDDKWLLRRGVGRGGAKHTLGPTEVILPAAVGLTGCLCTKGPLDAEGCSVSSDVRGANWCGNGMISSPDWKRRRVSGSHALHRPWQTGGECVLPESKMIISFCIERGQRLAGATHYCQWKLIRHKCKPSGRV